MNGPIAKKSAIVLLLIVGVVAVALLKNQKGASASKPAADSAQVPGVPRMLELGSVSCIPCKMMKPVMEELRKEFGAKLRVDFVDVREDEAAAGKYGIEAIPTQILFNADGKEIARHTGFWPKDEIVARFRELGVKL